MIKKGDESKDPRALLKLWESATATIKKLQKQAWKLQ